MREVLNNQKRTIAERIIVGAGATGLAFILSSCGTSHANSEPQTTTTTTVPAPTTSTTTPEHPSGQCLFLPEGAGPDKTIVAPPDTGVTEATYSLRQASPTTVEVYEVGPGGTEVGHEFLPDPTPTSQSGEVINPEYIFNDPNGVTQVGVYLRPNNNIAPGAINVLFRACTDGTPTAITQ